METIQALTTLDIFLIVCAIVVALVGLYLVMTLRKIRHITKVADDVATVVEKAMQLVGVLEKIPLESVQKFVEKIPGKEKASIKTKKTKKKMK